ncbi:MAG: hypothetical protein P1V35_17440, partial [Planctomycetota bacterium]|nr:hypothetical protein [Planctomycetota bacterium]
RHFWSTGGEAGVQVSEGKWLGWWTSQGGGKRFVRNQRAKATVRLDGRRLMVQFQVPQGQTAIRVDLPAGSDLEASIESIQAHPTDGSPAVNLMSCKRSSRQLVFEGNRLEAKLEADPWFAIELPGGLASSAFEFRMQCRVDQAPEWLRLAISQPNVLEETYLLGERGRQRAAQSIRESQFLSWIRGGLHFEWAGVAQRVSLEPDTQIQGRYHFQVDLEIPSNGASWTLRPSPCYGWQIGGIDVQWAAEPGSIAIHPTSMVEDPSGVWTSLWADAGFDVSFSCSQEVELGSKATLRGWIQ